MNKIDKKIGIVMLKIILILLFLMFSILSVAMFNVHVGCAIAFVAMVLTVLALDSMR